MLKKLCLINLMYNVSLKVSYIYYKKLEMYIFVEMYTFDLFKE
jgi:hypothetical protein